jgi:hypothetical protein
MPRRWLWPPRLRLLSRQPLSKAGMKIKGCEPSGVEAGKISVSTPNYPLVESFSASTPSTSRKGGGLFL